MIYHCRHKQYITVYNCCQLFYTVYFMLLSTQHKKADKLCTCTQIYRLFICCGHNCRRMSKTESCVATADGFAGRFCECGGRCGQ